MDSKIFYARRDNGLLITSNIEKYKRNIELGIYPNMDFKEILIENIGQYKAKSIGFDEIDNDYFQSIKEIFSKYHFEAIAFHETTADLSNIVLDVKHLVVGDKSKINLSEKNFQNLKEITFLSVKTFKGKILDEFKEVEKLILWYENKKSNLILEKFPNLKELTVNNGSLTDLDLRNNKELEKIDIHYCTKLEHVLLNNDHKLQKIFVENCKNLDVSNFPEAIRSIWPPRKETSSMNNIKSTEDEKIDNLIIDLKKNMEDFMKDFEPSYSQNDIDDCVSILSDYTVSIHKSKSKKEGMKIVESTVLKLNTLNEKCDFSLIETNEREQIAEIIILASHKMGYNPSDEDITEEWREW